MTRTNIRLPRTVEEFLKDRDRESRNSTMGGIIVDNILYYYAYPFHTKSQAFEMANHLRRTLKMRAVVRGHDYKGPLSAGDENNWFVFATFRK